MSARPACRPARTCIGRCGGTAQPINPRSISLLQRRGAVGREAARVQGAGRQPVVGQGRQPPVTASRGDRERTRACPFAIPATAVARYFPCARQRRIVRSMIASSPPTSRHSSREQRIARGGTAIGSASSSKLTRIGTATPSPQIDAFAIAQRGDRIEEPARAFGHRRADEGLVAFVVEPHRDDRAALRQHAFGQIGRALRDQPQADRRICAPPWRSGRGCARPTTTCRRARSGCSDAPPRRRAGSGAAARCATRSRSRTSSG